MTMGSTVRAMPMKMMVRERRKSAATSIRPWEKALLMMVNSLIKGAKGGEPVMAMKPARKSPPDQGSRRLQVIERRPGITVGRPDDVPEGLFVEFEFEFTETFFPIPDGP